MNFELLQQANRQQSKCGFRPINRSGSVLCLERRLLLPMVLQPNQTETFTKVIVGDTIFGLSAISCDQGMVGYTGVRCNVQLPNGRFLFGQNGQDIGQFCWVGSDRFANDPDLDCEPGTTFKVTLSDTNVGGLAGPLAVNMVFEGSEKFYFHGEQLVSKAELASLTDRYQGIVVENILAPSYTAGYGVLTPPGFNDDVFWYSSERISLPLAGPLTATAKINIDNGLDFVCRRLLFDLTPDPTVTAGSVLCRLRTGDGYALSDDLVDFPRYICGAEYPVDWKIRGGDLVYIDLALVDFAGTGSMVFQCHLEGAKRRRL